MFGRLYFRDRFFLALGACILIFIASFSFAILYTVGWIVLTLVASMAIADGVLLHAAQRHLTCQRQVADRLSLGDPQTVCYEIFNGSPRNLIVQLIDELPVQLQIRDFSLSSLVNSGTGYLHELGVTPVVRGEYSFGESHLYISTPLLSMIDWRVSFYNHHQVKVVPSIIQMRKLELEVFSRTATLSGIRKVRRLGENDEFEHIRLYQQGDHIKSINWKATSRSRQLMVNQFQNTRSQLVYCIIDKGRSMKMPFAGLTLLDHAINTSLVISNIVLRKFDRVGLVTFSDKIGHIVSAENTQHQLNHIIDVLYNQQTTFKESNFERLYHTLQGQIRRRSVILFFTNFEHRQDLERNLGYFRAINRHHLLVVIFFVNTKLRELIEEETHDLSDIYLKTFAERAAIEKEVIRDHLKLHGIQCILTTPQQLSVDVINKYLEIKARRQM